MRASILRSLTTWQGSHGLTQAAASLPLLHSPGRAQATLALSNEALSNEASTSGREFCTAAFPLPAPLDFSSSQQQLTPSALQLATAHARAALSATAHASSLFSSLRAASAGMQGLMEWPRMLMARNLRKEPEPFEGELDEDDYVEGEFEDLEESNFVGANDDLDFDLLADDDLNEEDGGYTVPTEGVVQR